MFLIVISPGSIEALIPPPFVNAISAFAFHLIASATKFPRAVLLFLTPSFSSSTELLPITVSNCFPPRALNPARAAATRGSGSIFCH